MYRAWKLITIASIVLMMVIPTSVIAQSGFTAYDNKYFTMIYPSGWTVNDTGLGDLLYHVKWRHHTVIFDSPNDNARIHLDIYGPVHAPIGSVTLDKNYWLDQLS